MECHQDTGESEESSDARSEHGDTTDAENEIIYYWEGLRRGILSYPVPLRLHAIARPVTFWQHLLPQHQWREFFHQQVKQQEANETVLLTKT